MTVRTERVGSVLIIQLDRPQKRNAIDLDMAVALDAAIEELEAGDDLRVGLLTASGSVFCAGTDMSDRRDKRTARGGEYGLLRRERTKPLIAVVDGAALGGGFEIVLACDMVVASDRAQFGLPETRRGLVATGGGLFRAGRALPQHIAAEMLLTGLRLDAHRAFALGLVNRVLPSAGLTAGALELAKAVVHGGPHATAETLTALRGFTGQDDHLGWWVTGRAKRMVADHPEADEGRTAFFEGRLPAWVAEDPDETER
ncbi:enoyl-CoA hydratase-related protein [Microbacterium sp. MAHUQ-60]|uniref:enoyl-CoA hydratase-related protein n=1 Tax=unclassified Microbacterium TaxID=2609290 RepID=UPI00360A3B2A